MYETAITTGSQLANHLLRVLGSETPIEEGLLPFKIATAAGVITVIQSMERDETSEVSSRVNNRITSKVGFVAMILRNQELKPNRVFISFDTGEAPLVDNTERKTLQIIPLDDISSFPLDTPPQS